MWFGFTSALFGQIDSKKTLSGPDRVFSGFGARFGVQGLGCSQVGLTLGFGLQTGSLRVVSGSLLGCFRVAQVSF